MYISQYALPTEPCDRSLRHYGRLPQALCTSASMFYQLSHATLSVTTPIIILLSATVVNRENTNICKIRSRLSNQFQPAMVTAKGNQGCICRHAGMAFGICHSATFCRQTNRTRFVILQPNESRFMAALSPTHAETGRQTIRPTFQLPGRNVQPLPGAFIRSYIMIAAAMAALSDSAPPRIGSFRCKSAHANTSEEMPRASLPITSTKRSPTGGRV